jgi:hypothetical protein
MDVIVFDTAVNLGVERALQMLNASRSIYDFLFARITYYVVISKDTKIKFLRGWLRRVLTLWDEIRERGE